MDKTYAEYKQWLGTDVDPSVHELYAKAAEMLKTREVYEKDIMVLDEKESSLRDDQKDTQKRMSIYSNYIELEFKDGSNPARLQNLYERRITDLCLYPHIWTKYIEYMDQTFKSESDTLKICERAVRNIPNSAAIWVQYLRALERYEKPKEMVLSMSEKALACDPCEGIMKWRELWLTYIDYKRRHTAFKVKNILRLIYVRRSVSFIQDYH